MGAIFLPAACAASAAEGGKGRAGWIRCNKERRKDLYKLISIFIIKI